MDSTKKTFTTTSDVPNSGIIADSNTAQVHNEEMELAWQFLTETNVSVFLTGKAGTGKTTFLRKLRDLRPKRMVVLAPTGVAAINAQGQTIHSFFQLPFGPIIPGGESGERKGHYKMGKEKKNVIKTLDLLVIDEISMVRCDLLDAVDAELRKYKDRNKPFGGVQLLLVGDLQQLAPVAKDSEWQLLSPYYSTQYFFGSKALSQINYVTIELKHIYRQTDKTFVNLLAKIRNNCLDSASLNILNSRYIQGFNPPDGDDWIRLTTHNNMAHQYNEEKLASLSGSPMVFNAEIEKNFPESSYPADERLVLKAGAQVMFIKNDPSGNHAYYNGKIGIVRGFGENDSIVVWSKEDNANISVERVVWENTKYVVNPETKEITEVVEGTFRQYPLRLAWAITVHKSQGLTFDHAVLDVNSSFAHGQTYVALSRCRTLDGLVLARPLSQSSIITDASVNRYVDNELERAEVTAKHLPDMRFEYYLMLLDEMFSFVGLQQDYDHLTRVVDEHLYHQYPDYLELLKSKKGDIKNALIGVSCQFRNQYLRIMQSEGLESQHLHERLTASNGYFSNKLMEIFTPVMKAWTIQIGNKQVSERYTNALDAFKMSLAIKIGVFKYIGDEGFSVRNYLSAKAKSSLEDLKSAKKSTSAADEAMGEPEKKVKKEKAPKGESQRISLKMYKEGKSIAEIAKERSLTQGTIESHLAGFVASGELSIDDLVSKQHQRIIEGVLRTFDGAFSLTDVKNSLPDDYTYGEIRLVEANMRKRNS